MQGTIDAFNGKNISASTLLLTGAGTFRGIFASSSSSGTCAVYDGTSAAGTKLVDTFTMVAATSYVFNISYSVGLFIVIGGTTSATVMWI